MMFKSTMQRLALGLILLASCVEAAQDSSFYMPYARRSMKYPTYSYWKTDLRGFWAGWKRRFLKDGVVQATDTRGTAAHVSEGQSYGLLLSLWMNDTATFNSVYAATESKFWNSAQGWYNWCPENNCNSTGTNFAGDADQDILGALIFASALVDSGYWKNPSNRNLPSYKAKAIALLPKVWSNLVNSSSFYIRSWPSADDNSLNPSYHMPHWYPVFAEFADSNKITGMDWSKVRSAAYALINAQPSSSKGMARNFSTATGGIAYNVSSSISTPTRDDMGFDAIRVPFRMGLDAIWYRSTSSVAWCKSIWSSGFVSPDNSGLYTLTGSNPVLYGWSSGSTCNGGGSGPCYEHFMPQAMWGTAAAAVQDSLAKAKTAVNALIASLSQSSGKSYIAGDNPDTVSTTAPCNNYFAQSLGLLGMLAISGNAPNVWDDMKHVWKVIDTSAHLTSKLKVTSSTVKVSGAKYYYDTLKATFSHAVVCTLHATARPSGATLNTVVLPASTTLNYQWSTLDRDAATFKAGDTVNFSISLPGWTSTPDSAKTIVYVMSATPTGILERSLLKANQISWSGGRLRVSSQEFQAGKEYHLRVLDFNGRILLDRSLMAQNSESGVEFELLNLSSSKGVRILEISDGKIMHQCLLPIDM